MTEEQEQMVLNNENLIYFVLKNYGLYNKIDEYFDLCMIGLCKGVKKFDKTKGFAESSYLIRCISNELNLYFRHKRVKTIPLEAELDNSDDNCFKLENVLADKNVNIESDLANKELMDKAFIEIKKLSPKQKFVILNLYFNENKTSQRELAKTLKVSQSTISKIKKKALKTLKERLK